jgi:hypothetical protein
MPFYGEPLDVRITVVGAIAENMPPPISQQMEWVRKWGWIPREHGASGEAIPWTHVPHAIAGVSPPAADFKIEYDVSTSGGDVFVPNLNIVYDPMLASGKFEGFESTAGNDYVRMDDSGRPLPPMPRLPVSPTLSYFGEVK